jgi:hypothetical protein
MMDGENSSIIYLTHCKNFYKYHNVPPPSKRIKKLKIKKMVLENLFIHILIIYSKYVYIYIKCKRM